MKVLDLHYENLILVTTHDMEKKEKVHSIEVKTETEHKKGKEKNERLETQKQRKVITFFHQNR